MAVPKKVILSHPFSGAAYGWFEQFNPYLTLPKLQVPGHPYYRYLYGPDFLSWIDPALTLLLLYEEVVLPPADAFLPGTGDKSHYPSYRNSNLGVESDWDMVRDVVHDFHERAEQDRQDQKIAEILRGIPGKSQEQIIASCYLDVFLSSEFNVPIVCGAERRELIQRLAQISALSLAKGAKTFTEPTLATDYVRVSGLSFGASTVEELYELKSDSTVRDYAEGFLRVIHTRGSHDRNTLPDAVDKAIRSEKVCRNISGILNGISRGATYAGLIPFVATIASAAGIVAMHGEDAARSRERANQWYELAVHVKATHDRKELLAAIAQMRELETQERS